MTDLSSSAAESLIHHYADFGRRVNILAAPLTEEQFWIKPYRYGNSFGNLVLHLTGNLNYYIGTRIAQTGYIRNRESEFTASYPGQKARTLHELDDAVAMVIRTIKSQQPGDWTKEYSAVWVEDVSSRFGIFLRCAVHFHHHIGQMIYLSKELTLEKK